MAMPSPSYLLVLLTVGGLITQSHPDFSGRWTLDPKTSMSVNSGGLIGGTVIRIEQDANHRPGLTGVISSKARWDAIQEPFGLSPLAFGL
jgi:hypothetical protein